MSDKYTTTEQLLSLLDPVDAAATTLAIKLIYDMSPKANLCIAQIALERATVMHNRNSPSDNQKTWQDAVEDISKGLRITFERMKEGGIA